MNKKFIVPATPAMKPPRMKRAHTSPVPEEPSTSGVQMIPRAQTRHSMFLVPSTPFLKASAQSTPFSDSKKQRVTPPEDSSDSSLDEEVQSAENDLLYSEYLRSLVLESLIDKNIKEGSVKIDDQLNRLQEDFHKKEEERRSWAAAVKDLQILCQQKQYLNVLEDSLQLASDKGVGDIEKNMSVRLKRTCDRFELKNVVVDELCENNNDERFLSKESRLKMELKAVLPELDRLNLNETAGCLKQMVTVQGDIDKNLKDLKEASDKTGSKLEDLSMKALSVYSESIRTDDI